MIRGLLDEGEYRKAAQASDWNEWLIERKGLPELAEEIEELKAQRERGGQVA